MPFGHFIWILCFLTGLTFFILSQLAEKGIIKVKRFKSAPKKIPYSYMLTPQGLEEKAKITLKFLKRKLSEYEEIKQQIQEIKIEAEKDKTVILPDAIT